MVDANTKKRVNTYYTQAEIDYTLLWHLRTQQAMHFGFWDAHARTLRQALKNQDRIMAEAADVTKQDRVLDAGCGVGGSSLFLAKTYGCNVVGISIVERQVRNASRSAHRSGLSDKATFQLEDFTATSFADSSFDVVWATESACYAPEKELFLREAFRVLKPGGRLIVADGFALKTAYEQDEATLMAYWLSGWGVVALDTANMFCAKARAAGFDKVYAKDYSAEVIPSSRLLFRYARLCSPADWLLRRIGARNQVQSANVLAARYQYIALKRKLWQYAVVTATKPLRNAH